MLRSKCRHVEPGHAGSSPALGNGEAAGWQWRGLRQGSQQAERVAHPAAAQPQESSREGIPDCRRGVILGCSRHALAATSPPNLKQNKSCYPLRCQARSVSGCLLLQGGLRLGATRPCWRRQRAGRQLGGSGGSGGSGGAPLSCDAAGDPAASGGFPRGPFGPRLATITIASSMDTNNWGIITLPLRGTLYPPSSSS